MRFCQKGQSTIEAMFVASFLIGFVSLFLTAALLFFQTIYWNKIAYEILLCHLEPGTAHECSRKILEEKTKTALVRWNLSVVRKEIKIKKGRPHIFLQLQLLNRFNYEIQKEIDPQVWK